MITLEDQLEHERYYRRLGQSRTESQLDRAVEQGRVQDTPMGSGVMRRCLLDLSRALATEISDDLGKPGASKAYSVLLKELEPDGVALIALQAVLNYSQKNRDGDPTLAECALAIGRSVYGELLLAGFSDVNPALYETLVKDLQGKMSKDLRHRLTVFRMQAAKEGIPLLEWTPSQKMQVGMFLMDLMERHGLVERELVRQNKRTVYVVHLVQGILDLMKDLRNRTILMGGFAAPCIVPPRPWTMEDGGFYGDLRYRATRYFKGSSIIYDVMAAEGCSPETTLIMLNAHQSVPWSVNTDVLNLVQEMMVRGYETKTVATVAAYEQPERPDYLDGISNVSELTPAQANAFTKWKALKRDWHTKVRKVGRVEGRLSLALAAARSMQAYDKFWYVYQVDYRGRMYPVSGPLNPQGSDVQKALLRAADGELIDTPEALYWFKLAIAAKFGIDKLSPSDCIKWVDDNHDSIIQAATDPLDSGAFEWWGTCDKPLQFMAFAFEYKRYCEGPETFLSRLATGMDGTCNGLQNYSALLRDEIGGRATNLISDSTGVPNDIYGDVARSSYTRLLSCAVSNERTMWMEAGFNRGLTKKSVMTQVYGSTYGTCRKSILDYCNEKALFDEEIRYDMAEYAAKLVWSGIGDVVVCAPVAMSWLRKCSSLIMKEGADYITWLTPSGHRVVQIYDEEDVLRVSTRIGSKVQIRLSYNQGSDVPDKKRHRNALPPNFIHSVDSAHMALVTAAMVRLMGMGIFMHFIHDDFGVLPKHAATLARVIREEFVKMHQNYSLDNFRDDYKWLPEPPAQGDLDITCVLDSVNFFR